MESNSAESADLSFKKSVQNIFNKNLQHDTLFVVRIIDKKNNKLLTKKDINYNNVFFDADLNIYKNVNGELQRVYNENFESVIVEKIKRKFN